jgi:putative transposase
MQYRRAFVPGGSFFFTVVTERRRPLFNDKANVNLLREAFRTVKNKRPFTLDAIVVMPDHLHCIWTLPPRDGDYSTRWRLIKTWFTKHCSNEWLTMPNNARCNSQEQAIWQHRFWEHVLRDETDYARHVEYIHYNPVKHGYVPTPLEWLYSSFRRYVGEGIYPPDWGSAQMDFPSIGEE